MNNEEKILEMLAAMQSDITTIKEDVKALDNKIEEGFKATRSELVEAVEAVGRKVERLEGSVKDVETVTARNAFELQLIKGKA